MTLFWWPLPGEPAARDSCDAQTTKRKSAIGLTQRRDAPPRGRGALLPHVIHPALPRHAVMVDRQSSDVAGVGFGLVIFWTGRTAAAKVKSDDEARDKSLGAHAYACVWCICKRRRFAVSVVSCARAEGRRQVRHRRRPRPLGAASPSSGLHYWPFAAHPPRHPSNPVSIHGRQAISVTRFTKIRGASCASDLQSTLTPSTKKLKEHCTCIFAPHQAEQSASDS